MEYKYKKQEVYEIKDSEKKYILEIKRGILESMLPGGLCGGVC